MKFLHLATVFFTIGLTFAKDFFSSLGLHADYSTIGALGLALTTMLIFRGLLPILSVAILTIIISQPDAVLASMSLDRDMLQAAAITIVLFPWFKKILAYA
jgi:hypothetical protein